jgi:hypothetical protein
MSTRRRLRLSRLEALARRMRTSYGEANLPINNADTGGAPGGPATVDPLATIRPHRAAWASGWTSFTLQQLRPAAGERGSASQIERKTRSRRSSHARRVSCGSARL